MGMENPEAEAAEEYSENNTKPRIGRAGVVSANPPSGGSPKVGSSPAGLATPRREGCGSPWAGRGIGQENPARGPRVKLTVTGASGNFQAAPSHSGGEAGKAPLAGGRARALGREQHIQAEAAHERASEHFSFLLFWLALGGCKVRRDDLVLASPP